MKVFGFFMIAVMYMFSVASSVIAGPIVQFIDNGASNPGSYCFCPMKNFLISLDNINHDNFSLQFPSAKDPYTHVIESKIVLAGMWVLQTESVSTLHPVGKRFEDLLIALFAGSLLIGLSGLFKKFVNIPSKPQYEKPPVKAKVSYEKTLWAESHGLL